MNDVGRHLLVRHDGVGRFLDLECFSLVMLTYPFGLLLEFRDLLVDVFLRFSNGRLRLIVNANRFRFEMLTQALRFLLSSVNNILKILVPNQDEDEPPQTDCAENSKDNSHNETLVS